MPESQPLKFSANPDHDIVNEMVDFWFGQRAVSSSVYVMKTEGKGLESNCSKQVCLGEQTVMGILTCTGVRYAYSIKSQQFVPIVTSYTLPPQGNGFYNFIDGEITLKIIWETYTDPPELGTTTGIDVNLDPGEVPPTVSEGITPDTITPIDVTGDSPIPQTVEEWRELQVILKDGFNLR
jgi:hypothetical protein